MRPILFTLFGFPVHSYGVMIVVAFLVGLALARRRAARFGLDQNALTDALILTLVLGVVGARVVFILQELPYYLANPHELLSPEFAGLTSFGGILFGVGYLLWWARRTKNRAWAVLDCIAPPFLVGHAIGRIGCLLNGCCYGGVCDPLFPGALRVDVNGLVSYHQPAQAYDSAMTLAAFFIVLGLERRNVGRGQSFALATIAYGLTRFIYEFWRAGTIAQVNTGIASSTYWIGWLTEGQAAALAMAAVGAGIYAASARRANARAAAPSPPNPSTA